MTGGLYMMTSPSGREYIGITRHFGKRYIEHLRHPRVSTMIGKACRKYGGKMVMTLLVICDDRETLDIIEQKAIRVYDTMVPIGYNLSPGGNSPKRAIMECQYCGDEFDGKVGTSKFCSNNCKSAARRKTTVDHITKQCAKCGSPFVSNKYHYIDHCSRTCSRTGMKYKRRSF